MHHDLGDIKRLRRSLGITQTELSNAAGVSQSMIAKIESGLLDPGFSKAQKIFDTLESLNKVNLKTAEDIMVRKIFYVDPKTEVPVLIKILKKHSISQLPVVDKGVVVGVVTESGLLSALTDGRNYAYQIMDESPPIINRKTPINIITEILKSYPLVLVLEKGVLKGIITKSDLLMKF